jgi:cellulose synthase (UDP-forming)
VVDDISSEGFKFYGRFPEQARAGTNVTGELYLPTGKLRFKAEVRGLIRADGPEHHVKALGCSFKWERETDRDDLNVFLYGSNLQWRLNHLGEQARTPFDWIAERLGRREHQQQPQTERWAVALIGSAATPSTASEVSLISVPGKDIAQRTLISSRRVPVEEELRVDVITRAGTQTLEGPCDFVETITSGATSLYVYRFQIRTPKAGG